MKNANTECQQLVARWKSLEQNRPTEMDFTPFGYPTVKGSHFHNVFVRWSETIAATISKTKSNSEDESQVADAVLTRLFRDIKAQIDAAQNNGIGWLLPSTPFLQLVAEIQAFMTQYVERRIALRKELLKFAETQLSTELLTVEKAAPLAQAIISQQTQILQDAESVEQAKEVSEAIRGELAILKSSEETDVAELKKHWEDSNTEIAQHSKDAITTKAELQAVNNELQETLTATKAVLKAIEAQGEKSDASIKTGEALITQANQKLTKALADINRQALAGAFDAQAQKVNSERLIWVYLFLAAIVWLLGVGWYLTKDLDPKAVFDYHNLFRALPFVAPAIWLGWLSARQAGLLARIHQDYAYKAATAVAFEGYKKEAAAATDDALSRQLLETTIRNFGENPIRIYSKSDDHVMPIEQLIATVKDDSTWTRVMDLLKALKPEKK